MSQQPSQHNPEPILLALSEVILDRQIRFVHSEAGSACILPIEQYIRLLQMEATVYTIMGRAREGDVQGIVDVVEGLAKWLLEGGGERYYTVGGKTDA